MSIKVKGVMGGSGGAGLPDAWEHEETLAAREAIAQYAAVERISGGVRNITAEGYKQFRTTVLGLGMALDSAAAGQSVKVNLFDPINTVWGG